jgi:hypothetical protein
MQLSLIDPRETATVTQAMHDDAGLRACIKMMRGGRTVERGEWPYVEHLCEVVGRPAWAVDDDGMRYVVVGAIIFFWPEDMGIADATIRTTARDAFERLDASAASGGKLSLQDDHSMVN